MRMGKIASSAEYRMDKQFQNLLIFGISIVFQIEKILKFLKIFELLNSGNFLIFQLRKFLKFLIYEIPKMSNLKN